MMTPKERIKTALLRKKPDRVPISAYEMFGIHTSDPYQHESYAPLMELLQTHGDNMIMIEPRADVHVFGSGHVVDTEQQTEKRGDQTITRTILHTPMGDLTRTVKNIDRICTTWQTEHWCKDLDDVEKALSIPYEPPVFDASNCHTMRNKIGDRGVLMSSLADPLWMAADLMDFSDYTVWALTETDHFERTVQTMHERNMENLKRSLDVHVADLYRICGPEYATPPYLPPALFERLVMPYVKQMVDMIHDKGSYVRFHCHGNVKHVLESILQTGADGIDPCEAPPDGDIELDDLKRKCGHQLCVFGNLQLKLLENGTPDQIDQAVKTCMKQAKEGGGYVIMPTAAPINIPLSTKTLKNYMQYIESALKYGQYD